MNRQIIPRPFLILVFACLAFPCAAHQLDEYLQATLIDIEPTEIKLQISLTPGVAVADKVIALIDRNHDGIISTDEAAAYAEILRHDLTVRLDGRTLSLKLAAITCPDIAELRTGSGIILLDFSARPGTLASGSHALSFENQHLPAISAYLINAMRPRAGSIHITAQKRNSKQTSGEIAFSVQPTPANQPRIHELQRHSRSCASVLEVRQSAAAFERPNSCETD